MNLWRDVVNNVPKSEEITQPFRSKVFLPEYEATLRDPWRQRMAQGAAAPPESRAVCPRNWDLAQAEVAAVAAGPAWTLL